MNTPVPSRASFNASPITVAIVGIAGAVAGSLAVWTALAPNTATRSVEHTCACECLTEAVPAVAPVAPTGIPAPVATEFVAPPRPVNGGPSRTAESTPRVRQAQHEVEGPMDRDIIRRIVRAHINEVRYCYNQGLATDPALSGRVAVEFTIGSAGTVLDAVVASSSLDDEDDAVAACVTKAVKRWKFPKFDGEAVVVTYPFVLSPT